MATGACGIDCSVCRLHLLGICSTCGSGRSAAGKRKMEAQVRMFNQACPILKCASQKKIHYCIRDCDEFPCNVFKEDEYPYGAAYLDMQARRRSQASGDKEAAWPDATPEFWDKLAAMDPPSVAARTGCVVVRDSKFRVRSLNETWLVDPKAKTLVKEDDVFGGEWDRQMPFLILAYLALASDSGLSGEMVSPRDLGGGQDYFRGHSTIETKDLEQVFGRDLDGFLDVAKRLDGREMDSASDVACLFHVLPKMPVQILLWLGDEEFPPRVSVLLDRNAFNFMPAEGIAAAVNLLSGRLVMAAMQAKDP